MLQHSLKQISDILKVKIINEPSNEITISGLNYAESAKENDLTLIDQNEHIKTLEKLKSCCYSQ